MARDVEARLTYLQWQPSYMHTRPYRIGQFVGRRRPNKQRDKATNLVFCVADHAETIKDVRGLTENEHPFNLDTNGFAYIRCTRPALTKSYEYSDPRKVENIFLPECKAILKREVEGADEIMIFDWKVGNNNKLILHPVAEAEVSNFDRSEKGKIGTPMMERIRNRLPEESQHLLSGRVQLINLWRPINGPVEDHPIAVCDRRTLDSSKLIETDMIRGNYTGTMLYPQYEPNSTCQWDYMSGQDVEDVLLFKGFDTKQGSVKYTPHTSFTPLNTSEILSPRASVERQEIYLSYARQWGDQKLAFCFANMAKDT
ncbi:hypothetical protein BJX76DRAFT_347853 [Aspergillus varians]